MPQKITHSIHGGAQGSWGDRRRPNLQAGEAAYSFEPTPDPEPRSPTHPGPDIEAGGDAVAQAAGGGDAVPQAGGGERSVDLYTRHTMRESCVNRAVLLRCLSAIHSWFVRQLRSFNALRAPYTWYKSHTSVANAWKVR